MPTSPDDSWDRVLQTFADQFEGDGTNFVYRRSQKGEAIRVSAEEQRKFLDEFDRNIRRSKWIIYVGLTFVLGGIIALSLLGGSDLSQVAVLAGIVLGIIPYFAYIRWAWAAPARELAGRTPIAGQRSSEEVQRLRFQGMTYGQLAGAAFGGLVIPFIGSSHQEVFSGWNRLWLVFGGALILLAAVQAFRKWRFEQEDSYRNVIPRSSSRDTTERAQDSTSRPKGQLWRYLPFAAILLAVAFIALTPTGKRLAHTPSFWPIVMIGFACWSLFTVARGFTKGQIEPFARGFYNTYQRETQPKRFWVSVAWNTLLGGICIWLALTMFRDASFQAVQDRCYNQHDKFGPQDMFNACTQLIEGKTPLGYLSMGDAFVYRAISAERLNNRPRAIADYTQAIRVQPDNSDAYLNRGLMLLDSMKLDDAVNDFSRAHELDPKSPWPLANRGIAYAWMKNASQAESDFRTVEASDPSNPVMLRGRALLSRNAGNLREAVNYLTASLKSDPDNEWALSARAMTYRELGESPNADADLRRLEEVHRKRARMTKWGS